MAIPKKRLEDLTCQFLMLSEMLCAESNQDVYDVLQQLSNVTDEELTELNFPFKVYCKDAWEIQHRPEKEKTHMTMRVMKTPVKKKQQVPTIVRKHEMMINTGQRKGEAIWQKTW